MSVPWYLMAKGKGGGGYKTASGPIVSISDAVAAPLRSLVANIDPVQDLHGYDNPWPAGGGKNKFDASFMTATNITVTDNKVVGKGSAFHTAFAANGIPNLTFAENTQYTLSMVASTDASASASGNGLLFRLTYTDSTSTVLWLQNTSTSPTSYQITSSAGKTISKITMSYGGTSGDNTWTLTNIQLEIGNTATAWTPYSNECPISGWSAANVWVKPTYDPTANPTATLQLGQTVYGGTLDVTNGVLTVDRAMVDFGNLDWTYNSKQYYFQTTKSAIGAKTVNTAELICSDYPIVPAASVYNKSMCQTASSIRVFNYDYSDPTVFTNAMSGVQLVYELATPIEYTLTPTEISTLQGQNNVWADSGDVTMEYLASGGANADLMKLAVAFMGRR